MPPSFLTRVLSLVLVGTLAWHALPLLALAATADTCTLRAPAAATDADPVDTDGRIKAELLARARPQPVVTVTRRLFQATLIIFMIDLTASLAQAAFKAPSSGDHHLDVIRLLGGIVAFVIAWVVFGRGLPFAKMAQEGAGFSEPPHPATSSSRDADASGRHLDSDSQQLEEQALRVLREVSSSAPLAVQTRLTAVIARDALAIVRKPDSRKGHVRGLTTLLTPLGVPKLQDVASRLERKLSALLVSPPDPVRLVFTAHDAESGPHAARYLREFLSDVPKTTPVNVWLETPIPTEIFSTERLQRLQTAVAMSGVPHIDWTSEMLRDPPSTRLVAALQEALRDFLKIERKNLIEEAHRLTVGASSSAGTFFQHIYDEIKLLQQEGWTIDVRWEEFPLESYLPLVAQLAHNGIWANGYRMNSWSDHT